MTPEGTRSAAPRRGCVRPGCLVRAPLGCFAFFLGMAVVLVFLTPGAVGRIARTQITEEFEAEHRGRLSVGDLRLAWFSEQRVEGLTLRDPEGAYVAAAELRLPPLYEIAKHLDSGRIGPVKVDLDASLERGTEGGWNLERALERKPTVAAEADARELRVELGGGEVRRASGPDLRFAVGRWRVAWSAPELEALGRRQLVLELDRGDAVLSDVRQSRLAAAGTLDGEAQVEVELAFGGLGALLAGRERPRSWSISARDAPADLLALLGPRGLDYAGAFGRRVGYARAARDGATGRVTLELRGEDARLDLAGVLEDGVLRGPAPAAADEAPEANHLAFRLEGFLADEVLPRLVPFLGRVRSPEEPAFARVELRSFAIPAGGRLEDLSLELSIELGLVAFVLFPVRSEDPAWTGIESGGPVHLPPLAVLVEGAVARFPDARIPLGGEDVHLSGSVDLGSGALDLEVRGSAAALGALAGRTTGDEIHLRVVGAAEAPEVRVD